MGEDNTHIHGGPDEIAGGIVTRLMFPGCTKVVEERINGQQRSTGKVCSLVLNLMMEAKRSRQ
jgi:hypothetical protein